MVPTDPIARERTRLVQKPKRIAVPAHGVVVFESRHAPGFTGELLDDFAKFLLVISGHGSWESAGREHALGPGMLCHIAARSLHRQRDLPGRPMTLYVIHYRPELLPGAAYAGLTAQPLLSMGPDRLDGERLRRVQALFQGMLFEQDARQPGWQAALQARLLELAVIGVRLDAPATVPERRDDGRTRVAAYASELESSFFQRQSLAAAAAAVGLSRRHFTTLFRELTGESWNKRVQRLRLDHALRLLADPGRSVTAVAFESGFDDLSHFHHTFKRCFACTPGEYRERHHPIRQSRPPGSPSRRRDPR